MTRSVRTIYLVAPASGRAAADLAAQCGVHGQWVTADPDPTEEFRRLLSAATGFDPAIPPDLTGLLTGFAGLERMALWHRALTVATETTVLIPLGVGDSAPPGMTTLPDWLRLVQAPGQAATLMDLILPRMSRHRMMPEVFDTDSRRAHGAEWLWQRCCDWEEAVSSGGVRLVTDVGEPEVAAARWIGLPVLRPVGTPGSGPARDEPVQARLHRTNTGFAAHIAHPFAPGTGEIEVSAPAGRRILVRVASWGRQFQLPAVLDHCRHIRTETGPTGRILVHFEPDKDRWPDLAAGSV